MEAEKLGVDTVWSAQAWGQDAVAPLGYLAAKTERIRLATGIMQISARTPSMTAMIALTLDSLSGGQGLKALLLEQVIEWRLLRGCARRYGPRFPAASGRAGRGRACPAPRAFREPWRWRYPRRQPAAPGDRHCRV